MEPFEVRRINSSMATALADLRPLELDGITLACSRVHIGKGVCEVGDGAELHRHEELQVEYALTGSYEWSDRTNTTALHSDQYLVIPPGLPHEWKCTEKGILLGAELRIAGAAAEGFTQALTEAVQGRFRRFKNRHVSSWTDEVIALARQPAHYAWREAMIGNLLHVWFAQILKLCMPMEPWRQEIPYTRDSTGDRSRLLVRHAIDFMQANYALPIKLKDIADQIGITPRHLTRLFSQYEQNSVTTNLLDIRLRRALEKLESTHTYSVKEVAYRCGFTSPSYFTQCFRKAYGRLPRDTGARTRA